MAIRSEESQPPLNGNGNGGNGHVQHNAPDLKSFMNAVMQSEEKTRFTLMLELLKLSNLEFITEYPNFTYTKAMTKYETWRASIKEVLDLSDDEEDTIVERMSLAFMKKNVSHKRRRSHELVNALRGEDVTAGVLDHENRGLKRFLGMK